MDMTGKFAQRLMWLLWPAFLTASVAEVAFFTVFDPFELHFFGAQLDLSRVAMYTLGFFGFWLLALTSSALTLFFEGTLSDSGRPPGTRLRRPAGCPLADDAQCCAVEERERQP